MSYSGIVRTGFSFITLFCIFMTVSLLSQAPTATTNAATGITSTAATLNGTVNANGLTTTVTFEYGTTTAYGSTVTAVPSPVSGNTSTPVSKNITGLASNTTYHYRVVGTNAGGTSNGADMTFTTYHSPPAVLTTAATAVGVTSSTLNGIVNANDDSTTVTFEYGTTTAYGTTVTADQSPVNGSTAIPVSKNISGLTPNTTYHYRVVATNDGGTSYGADVTFFTGTTTAPTVTTGSATLITTVTATLNAVVNGNGEDTNPTFEYGTTLFYEMGSIQGLPLVSGSTDTAVYGLLTGLQPGTTYHYRARAENYTGTTYGADMTFTTQNLTASATTHPATSVGTTDAMLNGVVNPNSVTGGITVFFQYGITTSYGTTVTANPFTVTGSSDTPVSRTIGPIEPNKTYHFRVVAESVQAVPVYGGDMTFTTVPLPPDVYTTAATSVTASGAIMNGIVNANNDSTIVTFEYGLTPALGSIVTADQSPVTGYANTAVSKSITGLLPNTTYYYRAVGQNSSGTTYGTILTFLSGTIPPGTVTDPATEISTNSAVLNGTVNANNDTTTVTFNYGTSLSYDKTVAAGQSPVSGNTNTAVNAKITGLIPGTKYYFRITAENTAGRAYGENRTFIYEPSGPSVQLINPQDGDYLTGIQQIEAEAFSSYGIKGVDFFIDGDLLGSGNTGNANIMNHDDAVAYIVGKDSIIKKIDLYGNTTPLFNSYLPAGSIALRNNFTMAILLRSPRILPDGKPYILLTADLRTGRMSGIDNRIDEVRTDQNASPRLQFDVQGNLHFLKSGKDGGLEIRSYSPNLKKISVKDITGNFDRWTANLKGDIRPDTGNDLDCAQGLIRYDTSGNLFLASPENGGTLILKRLEKDNGFKEIAFINEEINDFTLPDTELPDAEEGETKVDMYSITWDTASCSPGEHTVKAVACDQYGYEAEDSVRVNIPGLSLTLDAVKKKDRAWIITKYYAEITVTVENPGGITGVTYQLLRKSGSGEFTQIMEFTEDDLTGHILLYMDKYLEKDGAYTYVVEARGRDDAFVLRSPEVTVQ